MGAKYDPQAEAEVRHWFKQLLNEDIGEGSMTVEKNLKDGILLIKYVRNILPHPYNFNQKTPRNIIMYKCTVLFHQNHHQNDDIYSFINFISCKYKQINMSLAHDFPSLTKFVSILFSLCRVNE